MEVDNQHTEELTKMETIQKKGGENEEIEFDKIKVSDLAANKRDEYRRVPVPRHRMTPLRQNWDSILKTLVEHMKLQVRMNTKRHAIELKTSKATEDVGAIQKGTDFLKCFMLGFDLQDSVAVLRLDDLYLESFEIKDVKTLHGDHLSRCIGRICGEKGKTKFAIENSTRTRVVVADTKIHILGCYSNN
jgi:RNA-binding protein PNO1